MMITIRHLVKGIARAGQGTYAFANVGESLTGKVVAQLRHALQPCITEVKVDWGVVGDGDSQGVEIETKRTLFGFGKPKKKCVSVPKTQAPGQVPAIYDGSRLLVYKLLPQALPSGASVKITAMTPEGKLDLSVPLDKNNLIYGDFLHKLYARKMIQDIEEGGTADPQEMKRNITELGLTYQLATKYTSFIGVDQKQQRWEGNMVTRQIKNQAPQNPGGFRGHHRSAPGASAAMNRGGGGGDSDEECAYDVSGSVCHEERATIYMQRGGGGETFESCSFGMVDSDSSDGDKEECAPRAMAVKKPLSFGLAATPSPVVILSSCQSANGSFPPSPALAAILGMSESELHPLAWATALAIAWLEVKAGERKDEWELVVEKARYWCPQSHHNYPLLLQEMAAMGREG